MTTIGFQGEKGAYSELAALKYFNEAETKGYEKFKEVFKAVKQGEVDYGILPLENSTTGSIDENYDLLLKDDLYLVGEEFLKIKHYLLALHSNLKQVEKVYSHPQALYQCREFLEKNNLQPVSTFDTAGSAKMIKKNNKKNEAIIASELVSEIYHLKILKKDIGPETNITRFVIISPNEFQGKEEEMKTSLVFRTKHKPWALINALLGFRDNQVNLTKIESRPVRDKPWQYSFYLDFEGRKDDKKVKEALKQMKEHTSFLKILGSYPKG